MDLRQLTYFLRVAERRSITLAAAELNVAQPSLTKSMKMLEEELGCQLFHRLPRGVELTDAGVHLLRHAEAVKIQMTEAKAELHALQKGDRGVVTIGAGPAWLRRHLPEAIAKVIETRPDLKLNIVGGFDEALLRKLRAGEVDFVVAEVPWSQNADDLDVEILTSVELCVGARAGHPLAEKADVGVSDLLAYPWVLPVGATRARQRLDALFMARNISPPEPMVETESMAFMLAMVRNSDALTYITSTTVDTAEGYGLVTLASSSIYSDRNAGIIRRRGSWISPAAATVMSALRLICEANPEN